MMNARHFLRLHVNRVLIGTKDLPFHLRQAAKAYQVKKMNLEDRTVFIFQRLHYFAVVVSSAATLQLGMVPCTRNTYKAWIFLLFHFNSRNFWRNIIGPPQHMLGELSNGMKSCTLGTNELRMLTSRRYRVGPEFVVVRTGEHWPLTLQKFPFIIGCKDFCTGNLWGEGFFGGSNIVPTAN